MKFTKPWALLQPIEEGGVPTPVLKIFLRRATGELAGEEFVVDSGADVSMASRSLCEELGLTWNADTPIQVRGISPRPECTVPAPLHEISVFVPEAQKELLLPICFAEGDAPQLLGRERFFDAFLIQFNKRQSLTTFEW